MFSTIGRVSMHFDTSYWQDGRRKSEHAKNSENCPSEIFTCQICGYGDQTHVCMSDTRKRMSDTCCKQSEGCKNIVTQGIGKMDAEIFYTNFKHWPFVCTTYRN